MDVGEIRRVLTDLRSDVDPDKKLTDDDVSRIMDNAAELERLVDDG